MGRLNRETIVNCDQTLIANVTFHSFMLSSLLNTYIMDKVCQYQTVLDCTTWYGLDFTKRSGLWNLLMYDFISSLVSEEKKKNKERNSNLLFPCHCG